MSVRQKDTENLSRDNLKKVASLLAAEKPITKKAACEMLNIAYNTTRLEKILTDFKEKEEFRSQQRKKKRGTELTADEYSLIARAYLEDGSPIDNIAERLYRPTAVINEALDNMSLPRRSRSYSYKTPHLIPDESTSEQFDIGEMVWSAKYESLAEICELVQIHELGYVYRVWLKDEKWQQYAYQPAYELASLKHLQQYGVQL